MQEANTVKLDQILPSNVEEYQVKSLEEYLASGGKIIPQKQLCETISDIYAFKNEANRVALSSGGQPQETMEQFLYAYLVEKFGLRLRIIEQCATIINSVRFYCSKPSNPLEIDNEIELFARVLKNEIFEGFHDHQIALKKSVTALAK